ncbi:hypothetical protein IP70_21150 [alpha proteobacterium AAP38]|nr:hypothetical protein IP70_21150 [alpha proteobacterium AAP38]
MHWRPRGWRRRSNVRPLLPEHRLWRPLIYQRVEFQMKVEGMLSSQRIQLGRRFRRWTIIPRTHKFMSRKN